MAFFLRQQPTVLDLSLSTLLVEALPSTLTIALLIRYYSGSLTAARGSDIGESLLTRKTPDTTLESRHAPPSGPPPFTAIYAQNIAPPIHLTPPRSNYFFTIEGASAVTDPGSSLYMPPSLVVAAAPVLMSLDDLRRVSAEALGLILKCDA